MDTEGEAQAHLKARASTLGSTHRQDGGVALGLQRVTAQILTLLGFCVFTWAGVRITM